MRTTLDLPEELLKEVMKLTNTTTKSEAIKYVIERIVKYHRRLSIIKYRRKNDLDINLDSTRDRQ